jgi:hypothetical protein
MICGLHKKKEPKTLLHCEQCTSTPHTRDSIICHFYIGHISLCSRFRFGMLIPGHTIFNYDLYQNLFLSSSTFFQKSWFMRVWYTREPKVRVRGKEGYKYSKHKSSWPGQGCFQDASLLPADELLSVRRTVLVFSTIKFKPVGRYVVILVGRRGVAYHRPNGPSGPSQAQRDRPKSVSCLRSTCLIAMFLDTCLTKAANAYGAKIRENVVS